MISHIFPPKRQKQSFEKVLLCLARMASSEIEKLSDDDKSKIFNMVNRNEIVFVSPPPDALCNYCHKVAIFAYNYPCSHVYCHICFKFLVAEKRMCLRCPTLFDGELRPNRELDNKIGKLQTVCLNRKNGCFAVLSLDSILEHLEICDHSASKMLAKLGGDSKSSENLKAASEARSELNFKEIRQSLEQMKSLLEAKLQISEIERARFEDTVTKKWDCVVGGIINAFEERFMMFSASIDIKLQDALLEVDRKLKAERSSDQQNHRMEQAIEVLETIRQAQESSADAMAALKVNKNGVFVWEINDFEQKKQMALAEAERSKYYHSLTFYSSEFGYNMRLVVEFRENAIGVFLQFQPGDHDAYLPAVFHHRRTFSILDRSDRDDKRPIISVQEPRFRDGRAEKHMKLLCGYSPFCNYQILETDFKNVYLKDDTILLKVEVEPILPLLRPPYSRDGVLLWKVTNYQRAKSESLSKICEELCSESFYSARHGYRMQCFLYFDETDLNVYLDFVEGEYDAALRDIFAHKVTFNLLDQKYHSEKNTLQWKSKIDPKICTREEASQRMSSRKCHDVNFAYKFFERFPLLVNDSIKIEVIVEPIYVDAPGIN